MSQDRAIDRLGWLVIQAHGLRHTFDVGSKASDFNQIKSEAAAIIASYVGADHYIVKKIEEVQVSPRSFLTGVGLGEPSVTDRFIGHVNAAINLLDVTYGRSEPKPPICDPELWEHVEELVKIEAWPKIPAAVVTFVEDWFRKRGGDPRVKGAKLVGSDLFNRVLTDHPLGGQASEQAGWRFLGMGLAQAIGNLHRHNIENRADAEQLAWSVIGLGSLLLGEMRASAAKGGGPS